MELREDGWYSIVFGDSTIQRSAPTLTQGKEWFCTNMGSEEGMGIMVSGSIAFLMCYVLFVM